MPINNAVHAVCVEANRLRAKRGEPLLWPLGKEPYEKVSFTNPTSSESGGADRGVGDTDRPRLSDTLSAIP